MYCQRCGNFIPDGGKFCPACGTPVNVANAQIQTNPAGLQNQMYQPDPAAMQNQPYQPAPTPAAGSRNKKLLLIIILIAAAAVAAFVVVFFVMRSGASGVEKNLDLGKRYLDEQNYKEALIAFNKVIEIDPKCEDGYIGAADAYVGLGEYKNAESILNKGLKEVPDSVKIKNKLEEVKTKAGEAGKKVEDAEKESSEAKDLKAFREFSEKSFGTSIANSTYDLTLVHDARISSGLVKWSDSGTINTVITDLDADGQNELLKISAEDGLNVFKNPVQIFTAVCYEYSDGAVKEAGRTELLNIEPLDSYQSEVFLKNTQDGMLICNEINAGGSDGGYGDGMGGTHWYYIEVKYKNGRFETIYYDDASFSDYDPEGVYKAAREIADQIRATGVNADPIPFSEERPHIVDADPEAKLLSTVKIDQRPYDEWGGRFRAGEDNVKWGEISFTDEVGPLYEYKPGKAAVVVNPAPAPQPNTAPTDTICSFSSERAITDADFAAIMAGNYGVLPEGKSIPQMAINEI